MKKFLSIILFGCVLILNSCLKDKGIEDNQYGLRDPEESPVGVGFPQSANTVNVTGIELTASSQTINLALVNLLSDAPAEEDIEITLQVNQQLVADYNASNSPALEVLPANLYTISSLKVVIPKGQRTVSLPVTIPNSSTMNPSRRYGIGFSIVSVNKENVKVADNLRNVLFALTVRNAYDAQYEVSVELTGHPSASGSYDDVVSLATIDGNSLDAPLAVARIFAASSRLTIRINADNSLTLTSNAATIIPTAPGLNFYDPTTQTFHFDYTWGAGPRHIVGTARRL